MESPVTCLFCEQPEVVELFEIWGNEFMLETCCQALHEEIQANMADDPDYRKWLLDKVCHASALSGARLRRVADEDGQYLLDFNPVIRPIRQSMAKRFVNHHHRHNKAPAGWRFGAGIYNGPTLIGVVMCGRPVARAIDPDRVVEVNRLCIDHSLPASLVWNACSMAYGWCAREARKRRFEKIITYTLAGVESATSLKAAGWTPEYVTRGGSWNCPSRPRTDAAPTSPKIRWSRQLS